MQTLLFDYLNTTQFSSAVVRYKISFIEKKFRLSLIRIKQKVIFFYW